MEWSCVWGRDAYRATPDLQAIDRAAAEQGVDEGWVTLELFRQPSRVWVSDRVEPAAIAHGARLLATGIRGDHWILVAPAETPMAVELTQHLTPAGRTAWFEAGRTGPCPGPDPADHLPLDPAIKAVSISKANEEEQRAIDVCVQIFGVEDVKGMGRIPRARDAYKYAPLKGTNPDLQNDRPAWIVAFTGMLDLPRGTELARDPLCVLTELEPGPMLLLPWGTVDSPARPEDTKQVYRLPALMP
jgi:hypothetical protein